MGQQALRVALEKRGDHARGDPLLHRVERLEQVRGDQEVDLSEGQQRPVVDHRPAGLDRHVETVLAVRAVGQRLVEAAKFRLSLPVEGKRHLVERATGAHANGDMIRTTTAASRRLIL